MADDMNHAAGNSGVLGAGATVKYDPMSAANYWVDVPFGPFLSKVGLVKYLKNDINKIKLTILTENRNREIYLAEGFAEDCNGITWINNNGELIVTKSLPEEQMAQNAGSMTAPALAENPADRKAQEKLGRLYIENHGLRDTLRQTRAQYDRARKDIAALKEELADRDAMIADMQCKSIDRIQRMADAAAKIEALEAELAALKAKPSTRDNADVASTLLRAVEKYSENEEIANLEKELAERDDQIQTLRWELAALKASQSTPDLVQSTPSVDPGSQIAAFAGRWASRKLDGR